MARAPFSYAQLEQAFVQWARERADVRAAVVVGSRARRDHPADEWSDLDLIVYITDPQPYACDETWLDEIAEVWARTIDRTRGGDPEWLVLFADGVKGDFVLANGSAPLRAHLPFSPYKNVVRRGVRVLFDKDDARGEGLPALPAPAAPAAPTREEFIALVNRAWLAAARAAKWLRRGDLWPARLECDGTLRACLLSMLEWHAHAVYGPARDTWHEGRHLREWADARAVAELPDTFAIYDIDETWRALFATLDLFRWLALETAGQLNFPYPLASDRRVTAWLKTLRSARR